MICFKTIVFPTAFAELSQRTAPYVVSLARAFDSHVHVLHVCAPEVALFEPGGLAAPTLAPGPPQAESIANAEETLRRFAARHLGSLSRAPVCVARHGPVALEICDYAREIGANLIVMGTHADGLLKRLVFGSIGKATLEHASSPVLLAPVPRLPEV